MFCGSDNVVQARIVSALDKVKEFNPNIGVKGVGISVGSIGSKKSLSFDFISHFCRVCFNYNAVDEKYNTRPITVQLVYTKNIVIIPYCLFSILHEKSYTEFMIINMVNGHKNDFVKYFTKYAKTGKNKCKGSKVGYKLDLDLKEIKVLCWVIVEPIGEGVIYRLCYGGNKIKCP